MSKRKTGVKRRGNKFVFVLDRGRDENGKRRQDWLSFDSREDAEKAWFATHDQRNRGTYVAPSRQTVAEYLSDWLGGIRADVKPSTWESYRWAVAKVVAGLGSHQLQRLQAPAVGSLKADLLASGLSPTSVRYVLVVLGRALGDAVAQGLVQVNVASGKTVRRPKVNDTPAATWDAASLRAFLEHVREDRLFAIWRLAATTGMRRGELLGLRTEDVDLDGARCRILEQVGLVGGKPVVGSPKSGRGRTLDLDPATVAALRAYRRNQIEERMAWGEAYTESGRFFTTPDGQQLHPDRVSKIFVAHVRNAGLPRLSIHGLRHSYATTALQASVPVKVVSERLGHATIGITLGTYAHVLAGMQREAAHTFAAEVLGE